MRWVRKASLRWGCWKGFRMKGRNLLHSDWGRQCQAERQLVDFLRWLEHRGRAGTELGQVI